jgi:ferredoxin
VPSYKIQSTLGEMIKRKGEVDNDFMHRVMDTAWSKCSCCNRCATYCPFGIDMGVMFGYVRGLCFAQGFVPWELKIGSGMHRIYRAQMDITTEDWVDTCEWMAEEYEDDWPGLEIPVDKQDADIIYTVNAREPKHYPEDLAEAAILCSTWPARTGPFPARAGRRPAWPCSPATGGPARLQVESVYAAMDRLKPKRMVVTECGHAYRATVLEGPYWAGLEIGQDTRFPAYHYVEWVAEALRTGKLKIDPAKKAS